jgi:hypothetical protein
MEDIINIIDGQVQIIFERGAQPLLFRDAIWMYEAAYANTSRETILAIQEQRYADFLAVVNAELPPE